MLTYIQITAAKPVAKAYSLRDALGLFLAVKPHGSKLWLYNYRYLDKQKTLHLGPWPALGLADARGRRDDARKQIATGIDPSIEKKRARIAAKYAAANTVKAVAEEWLVKCDREGLAPVTLDKIRWLLAKAYPVIGSLPIAQITPHEALAVLRRIEATGRYESADRMRSVLSRVPVQDPEVLAGILRIGQLYAARAHLPARPYAESRRTIRSRRLATSPLRFHYLEPPRDGHAGERCCAA